NWHESHDPVIAAPILADSTSFQLYKDNLMEIYHSLDNDYPASAIRDYIENILELPPNQVENSSLRQNFPNPFFQKTEISYALKEDFNSGNILIYNIRGQLVKKIALGNSNIGSVFWNGKDKNGQIVGSGIYFYKLEANEETVDAKRMLLIR
ncbi:MAG: FlgD immunoglobulin-like domain containing protein, partial [Candidatus Cloacimonadota bacterium]|nr:FlgD immunoglobulin-like domain containing protein [Candidatus Cloacimonadota bacterium]